MKTFMSKDRWVSLGALVFSGIVYYLATKFPKSLLDVVGSSVFPQLLAVIIAVCSVILFITAGPDTRTEEERKAAKEKFMKQDWIGLLVILGDLAMYLFCFKRIGFIITTILFVMIFTLYFDKERDLKGRLIHGAIFAVGFTVVVWLLFSKVLHVLLPTLIL